MNALLLNKILVGVIVLIIIGTGAGFYYASELLKMTALETDRVRTDASVTSSNLSKLERLKTQMEKVSDVEKRAQQIVSNSQHYQYQDQIVQDVNAYAKLAGVEVSGFNFAADDSVAAGPASRSSSAARGTTGLRTINATVTLKTPIPHENFLRFLMAIERNLTKMQVTGINMTPDEKNPDLISNPTIGLQVYVRG